MKPKKGKSATLKQPVKKSTKRSTKAPAQGSKCKQPAPNKSDDSSSNDTARHQKRKQHKKGKHIEEVDEDESKDIEEEEIIESDKEVQSGKEPGDNDKVIKKTHKKEWQLTIEKDECELQDENWHQLNLPVELHVKKDTMGLANNIFRSHYCEIQERRELWNGHWSMVPVVQVRCILDKHNKIFT